MGKQTFIEINGKKYDAVTGKLMTGSSASASPAKVTTVKPNTGVVDGFTKQPRKPKPAVKRSQAQHAAKTQQKSQTLMRKTVAKPAPVAKKTHKKPAPTQLKKKLGASPVRQQRANTVSQSPHIQKFEHPKSRSSVVKKVAPVAVKQAPAQQHAASHKSSHQQKAHTGQRSAAAEKLIEAALANAESHNEPAVHQKRRRKSKLSKRLGISTKTAAMSSAALAAVLLAGFFAMQNVPNFAMRVAATRAGFDATMPGYQPSGFSFRGPINYTSGEVTISFRSNTGEREYDVV